MISDVGIRGLAVPSFCIFMFGCVATTTSEVTRDVELNVEYGDQSPPSWVVNPNVSTVLDLEHDAVRFEVTDTPICSTPVTVTSQKVTTREVEHRPSPPAFWSIEGAGLLSMFVGIGAGAESTADGEDINITNPGIFWGGVGAGIGLVVVGLALPLFAHGTATHQVKGPQEFSTKVEQAACGAAIPVLNLPVRWALASGQPLDDFPGWQTMRTGLDGAAVMRASVLGKLWYHSREASLWISVPTQSGGRDFSFSRFDSAEGEAKLLYDQVVDHARMYPGK